MDPQIKPQKSVQQQNTDSISESQQQAFIKIHDYLKSKDIEFKVIEHQPTRTSQESAKVRNTPLQWGSKTMLVKGAKQYGNILLIYRANTKISWKKLRKIPEIGRKAQMAVQQDVINLGVKPGGVPPFPHLIGITGIMDKTFLQTENMAFNAGHKCKSIIMRTKDYPMQDIKIEQITQD